MCVCSRCRVKNPPIWVWLAVFLVIVELQPTIVNYGKDFGKFNSLLLLEIGIILPFTSFFGSIYYKFWPSQTHIYTIYMYISYEKWFQIICINCRSREHSPCRIPVGKETSPMRPGGESPAMASTADINGNALLAPSPSSSLRVLNGHALENGHSGILRHFYQSYGNKFITFAMKINLNNIPIPFFIY